jgi:hypothetical protein
MTTESISLLPPTLTLPLKGGGDCWALLPSPSPLEGEGGEGGDVPGRN